MLANMSSMLLSMCCKRMANVLSCPIVPSWRRISSINLDRHRQSCPFARQIVSIFRMSPNLDGTHKHHCWSNLASQHLVQPTILRVQIIRRNFVTPTNIEILSFFFLHLIYSTTFSLVAFLFLFQNIRSVCLWNWILTNVSASKKTHFSYCVKRQQCNFVKVIPNSGRDNNAKLAASFESSTFTSCTKLNTVCNFSRIDAVTPGVIKTANWWAVLAFFNE